MEFNLDKTSVKVLRYIADEHEINPAKNIEMLKIKFGDDLDMDYLLECGYVTHSPFIVIKNKTIKDDFYSISAKGWAYLEHTPTQNFKQFTRLSHQRFPLLLP